MPENDDMTNAEIDATCETSENDLIATEGPAWGIAGPNTAIECNDNREAMQNRVWRGKGFSGRAPSLGSVKK